LASFKIDRPVDLVNDVPADTARPVRTCDVRQQDPELVAPQPGDQAALPDSPNQVGCDFLEESIADAVAERIVHRLEPVEIENGDRKCIALSLPDAASSSAATRRAGWGARLRSQWSLQSPLPGRKLRL
jgi:hypothetical protein